MEFPCFFLLLYDELLRGKLEAEWGNIDNPDIEKQFKDYAREHKISIENAMHKAMKLFLDLHKQDDTLVYTKKNPLNYLHKIEYDYDEALVDDVALTHIDDSATYVHDLRRKSRCR